ENALVQVLPALERPLRAYGLSCRERERGEPQPRVMHGGPPRFYDYREGDSSRSSGGAISVTRSLISVLLGSGSSVISRSARRVVQAYTVLPSTWIMHSLHALALMHEKRMARLGSWWTRIQR